jgi:hypothetical protein
MPGTNGRRATRKTPEQARRDFADLLGVRDVPPESVYTPLNIIRRPIELPPMRKVKQD